MLYTCASSHLIYSVHNCWSPDESPDECLSQRCKDKQVTAQEMFKEYWKDQALKIESQSYGRVAVQSGDYGLTKEGS